MISIPVYAANVIGHGTWMKYKHSIYFISHIELKAQRIKTNINKFINCITKPITYMH